LHNAHISKEKRGNPELQDATLMRLFQDQSWRLRVNKATQKADQEWQKTAKTFTVARELSREAPFVTPSFACPSPFVELLADYDQGLEIAKLKENSPLESWLEAYIRERPVKFYNPSHSLASPDLIALRREGKSAVIVAVGEAKRGYLGVGERPSQSRDRREGLPQFRKILRDLPKRVKLLNSNLSSMREKRPFLKEIDEFAVAGLTELKKYLIVPFDVATPREDMKIRGLEPWERDEMSFSRQELAYLSLLLVRQSKIKKQ